MKKYALTAMILTMIAGVCAALIDGVKKIMRKKRQDFVKKFLQPMLQSNLKSLQRILPQIL